MSGSNLRVADNLHKGNQAFCTAMSGTEILRNLLASTANESSISSDPDEFMNSLASYLSTSLATQATVDSDDPNVVHIPSITLDATNTFTAILTKVAINPEDGDWALQAKVTGCYLSSEIQSPMTRNIQTSYSFAAGSTSEDIPFFSGGVVSRGPISMTGNAKILGVNHYSEGNIYLDASDPSSPSSSFTISGSSKVDGNVSIVKDDPTAVKLNGAISINQESIPTWWDQRWGGPFDDDDPEVLAKCHINLGVEPIQFPVPKPTAFKVYAPVNGTPISGGQSNKGIQDNVIVTGNVSGGPYTLQNVYVPADTNPRFSGHYTINGIIYIEQPNRVAFSGSTTINGIIIAAGDHENADPQKNSITFTGDATNSGVESLDPYNPIFDGIREVDGISILAPGFELSIGASFDAVNGGIVGNGIRFSGNPQVTLGGPLINYSADSVSMCGSTCLRFDLSKYGSTLNSMAFESVDTSSGEMTVSYDASAYQESF